MKIIIIVVVLNIDMTMTMTRDKNRMIEGMNEIIIKTYSPYEEIANIANGQYKTPIVSYNNS